MCAPYGNSRKWESKEYAEAKKEQAEERRRRLTGAAAQKQAQSQQLSSEETSAQSIRTIHTPQHSGTFSSDTLPPHRQRDPNLYSPESRHSTTISEDQITMRKTSDENRRRQIDLHAERQRYRRIHNKMLEMYGNPTGDVDPVRRYDPKYKRHKQPNPSTTVPWTFDEWLAHQNEMVEIRVEKETRNIEKIQRQMANPISATLYNGKDFDDKDRGMVLGEKTIWRPGYEDPERWGGNIWPTATALLFEGDQRQASAAAGNNFRRFLPLVRQVVPGNDTVKWEMLNKLPPYQFDETWFPPEGPDIYLEREEIHEDDVPYLLNRDLLDTIDRLD